MKYLSISYSKFAWQLFAASYVVLFAVCGSAYVFSGNTAWIARAFEAFLINIICLMFYTSIVFLHDDAD